LVNSQFTDIKIIDAHGLFELFRLVLGRIIPKLYLNIQSFDTFDLVDSFAIDTLKGTHDSVSYYNYYYECGDDYVA